MQSAQFDRNTITITSENKETVLKTNGSVIKFDGYLKIYKDPKKEDRESILPKMSKGVINIENIIEEQHFTQLKQAFMHAWPRDRDMR